MVNLQLEEPGTLEAAEELFHAEEPVHNLLESGILEAAVHAEEPVQSWQEPGILEAAVDDEVLEGAVDAEEPVHNLLEPGAQLGELELDQAQLFAVPLSVDVLALEG